MTCIIIEDQAPAQRLLMRYIKDSEVLDLKGTFSDATKALHFLNQQTVDLIFLDIHLPKITGMDFLRMKPSNACVILTTAYTDYALESYEHNVVDYLLKPFSFQRFLQAVTKVQQRIQSPQTTPPNRLEPTEIFIKSGYDHVKVEVAQIRYIKSDADYTELIMDDKKHLSSESLKFWIGFLSPQRFVQIHKSYLINISKIDKVSGNRVFLDRGEELPIGRTYRDAFTERFLKR